MSLAVKHNDLTVSELKLPSPSDLCLGQISLKNCKDATIGTKIDGNIIVNQFFNDIPADKAVTDGLAFTDSVVLKDWTQKLLKYKYVWISLILAVVMTAVLCILYIPQNKSQAEDIHLPHNYSMRLRTRSEWFSTKPEVDCDPLRFHPAKYVIIAHTVTTNCYKEINCENVIKGLQTYDLKNNKCDISYNFVIAGDGYIYEGRGWGIYGAHTYGFNCDSIGVAFLGNYNEQYLTPIMVDAFQLLIEEGLKLGEIAQDFKLFGQSQVRDSESPGIHVIETIKKWKGWAEPTTEDLMCT